MSASPPPFGGALKTFAPPPEDFWTGSPHAGPLDTLVAQSVLDARVEDFAGGRRLAGRMNFSNPTLTGPPGRLHGGLHCVARIFPPLSRLRPDLSDGAYPLAIQVKLGKAIPMAQDVDFRAETASLPGGRWWMASRFLSSERLDAAAWALLPEDLFAGSIVPPGALSRWKERYQAALAGNEPRRQRFFGVDYAGTGDLFWARIPAAGDLSRDFLKRFSAGEGFYGPAFACLHLDNTGAIATAIEAMNPHFTTRLALKFAQARIPAGAPLLFLADRAGRAPEPFATARPVVLGGRSYGTIRTEVLLAAADFSRVYAWGYVSAHPIDYAKMAAALQGRMA